MLVVFPACGDVVAVVVGYVCSLLSLVVVVSVVFGICCFSWLLL